MVKNHLKTIAAPKKWPVKRKGRVFILRPNPGPHSLANGLSLNFVLVEMLNLAKTKKEAIYILHNKEVLVDGQRRKEIAFPVGLFDVISIAETKKHYRISMNDKGKFSLIEIEGKESKLKPYKIVGKKSLGKETQLNLFDGKNLLVDKDIYKVGDTIVVSENVIKEHVKMEKGNSIFLVGGSNLGIVGTIEDVSNEKIIYKRKANEVFETLKKCAFVIGKDKPIIKIQ